MAVFTPQHAVPVDAQLYLPQSWADDTTRRQTARIPEEIGFRTKGEIALSMLRDAHADAVPLGEILLADADYGRLWALRQWCREVGMRYGVGVHPTQRVWDAEATWITPMTAAEYAACVPAKNYRRISWRTGANGQTLSSRFAFLRVQVTQHGDEPPSDAISRAWRRRM
jgi:SRSO17 transposase